MIDLVTSIVVASAVGVSTGFSANVLFARLQSKQSKRRQKEFITKLHANLDAYKRVRPSDDAEVFTRREIVKAQVRELSQQIYGSDRPELTSFRLEETEYPKIPCRWCHRPHKPLTGSRGDCRHCGVPLDIWIACGKDECLCAESSNESE